MRTDEDGHDDKEMDMDYGDGPGHVGLVAVGALCRPYPRPALFG